MLQLLNFDHMNTSTISFESSDNFVGDRMVMDGQKLWYHSIYLKIPLL